METKPAPPWDCHRCSLHYLEQTLAVDEADLRVVCAWFGFEVIDGYVSNEQGFELREFLDVGHARSVPEWFMPGRRQGGVDERGLGAPHDRG